jgi:hypothetical protein
MAPNTVSIGNFCDEILRWGEQRGYIHGKFLNYQALIESTRKNLMHNPRLDRCIPEDKKHQLAGDIIDDWFPAVQGNGSLEGYDRYDDISDFIIKCVRKHFPNLLPE